MMRYNIANSVWTGRFNRSRTGAVVLTIVGVVMWASWRPTHVATASDVRTFELDTDFETFRTEFVHGDATGEIVTGAGFRMLEESSERVRLDVSRGSRPLLNALRRPSQAAIKSQKDYVVAIDSNYIDATRLPLRQTAHVRRTKIDVRSESMHACGELHAYRTGISAVPSSNGTMITVRVEMTVRVRVPALMASAADYTVGKTTEDIAKRHEESIRQFIDSSVSHQPNNELLSDL